MPSGGNRRRRCRRGPFRPNLGGWFANHLAVMLMVHLLPKKPVIDYGVSRAKLVEQTVCFILRGMGLKDEAIQREFFSNAMKN